MFQSASTIIRHGSMILAETRWISLSKHAGQSSTELNSIRLTDSLVQFSQLPMAFSYTWIVYICEFWCR